MSDPDQDLFEGLRRGALVDIQSLIGRKLYRLMGLVHALTGQKAQTLTPMILRHAIETIHLYKPQHMLFDSWLHVIALQQTKTHEHEGPLAMLKPVQRHCLALSFYQGFEAREIAYILGINRQQVETHLKSARIKLGSHLKSLSLPQVSHVS